MSIPSFKSMTILYSKYQCDDRRETQTPKLSASKNLKTIIRVTKLKRVTPASIKNRNHTAILWDGRRQLGFAQKDKLKDFRIGSYRNQSVLAGSWVLLLYYSTSRWTLKIFQLFYIYFCIIFRELVYTEKAFEMVMAVFT